jgi:hypothetical protein
MKISKEAKNFGLDVLIGCLVIGLGVVLTLFLNKSMNFLVAHKEIGDIVMNILGIVGKIIISILAVIVLWGIGFMARVSWQEIREESKERRK